MPRGAVIALGMGAELPNRLPYGSITASSEWIHDQTGEEGRSDETGRALDARMPDSKKTFHEWYMLPAWTARHDECHSTLDGEWLQIAFARPVELVAVETASKRWRQSSRPHRLRYLGRHPSSCNSLKGS